MVATINTMTITDNIPIIIVVVVITITTTILIIRVTIMEKDITHQVIIDNLFSSLNIHLTLLIKTTIM